MLPPLFYLLYFIPFKNNPETFHSTLAVLPHLALFSILEMPSPNAYETMHSKSAFDGLYRMPKPTVL